MTPKKMRILIVHAEADYFAGAEKMLGYFLAELVQHDLHPFVATVQGSRVAALLPPEAIPVWVEPCPAFSPVSVWRQSSIFHERHATTAFDIVHGWAARSWELASLIGWRRRCPVVGTLHDHPNASFISLKRRLLMKLCSRWALRKTVCVSSAVETACLGAGYPRSRLTVVRNGLPPSDLGAVKRPLAKLLSIGFLGAFTERKGLRDLFRIIDGFSANHTDWELHLGGGTQNDSGKRLLEDLRKSYSSRRWWPHVHWHGWVSSPKCFLETLDLLIVPSSDFDPFPTVLLEAGQTGVPVLAANVGGVAEIVSEGKTGWLFKAGDVGHAVELLRQIAFDSESRHQVGQLARERFVRAFSASRMVSEYIQIYSEVLKRR